MAKTKTFGVRLTPELISELERLKDAFSFASYGEMMETLIHLLQGIDEGVSRIKEHPREWKAQQVKQHLFSFSEKSQTSSTAQVEDLTWRRLRERFGEDGIQRIRELVADFQSGERKHG
jgi:hypothetical protein